MQNADLQCNLQQIMFLQSLQNQVNKITPRSQFLLSLQNKYLSKEHTYAKYVKYNYKFSFFSYTFIIIILFLPRCKFSICAIIAASL